MARNTYNEKTDKILGLANDIRNRTRRLLFHANLNLSEDAAVSSIIVDLHSSNATLANGDPLYKDNDASVLCLTIRKTQQEVGENASTHAKCYWAHS